MQGLLRVAAKWFDWFNNLLAAIACVLLVLITLAICIEIVSRAAFDISNPWLVELSEITLLYMTFLATAWVLGRNKHVSIDLLFEYISTRVANRIHTVLSLVAAICCFAVTYTGVLTVIDQYQNDIREPTIMAPMTFWITAVVPFGFALLGLQFVRRSIRAALGLPLEIDSR